jgi:acetyl-CoA carboxylase beta subunit
VVCGKCGEVGYEEEIEEQFNAIGFMALRKDERVVICTDKRRFDPWCGLVQTLEMLLFVAIQ